jgi:hypothetical protein
MARNFGIGRARNTGRGPIWPLLLMASIVITIINAAPAPWGPHRWPMGVSHTATDQQFRFPDPLTQFFNSPNCAMRLAFRMETGAAMSC